MSTLETLSFDNAFARLPDAFYTRLPPEPLPVLGCAQRLRPGFGGSGVDGTVASVLGAVLRVRVGDCGLARQRVPGGFDGHGGRGSGH